MRRLSPDSMELVACRPVSRNNKYAAVAGATGRRDIIISPFLTNIAGLSCGSERDMSLVDLKALQNVAMTVTSSLRLCVAKGQTIPVLLRRVTLLVKIDLEDSLAIMGPKPQ